MYAYYSEDSESTGTTLRLINNDIYIEIIPKLSSSDFFYYNFFRKIHVQAFYTLYCAILRWPILIIRNLNIESLTAVYFTQVFYIDYWVVNFVVHLYWLKINLRAIVDFLTLLFILKVYMATLQQIYEQAVRRWVFSKNYSWS